MTPPTTDTSAEAAIETIADGKFYEDYDASGAMLGSLRALLAERDALRDQLAAARNEALEEAKAECEAQRVKCNDNGQFEAAAFCKNLLVYIDALKSAAPAPREVTVQEAARVLLDLARDNYRQDAETSEDMGQNVMRWEDLSDSGKAGYVRGAILRALAKEEQSDG